MKKVVKVLIEWNEMRDGEIILRSVHIYCHCRAIFKPGDPVGLILKTDRNGKTSIIHQAVRFNMSRKYKNQILVCGTAEKMLLQMPKKRVVEKL